MGAFFLSVLFRVLLTFALDFLCLSRLRTILLINVTLEVKFCSWNGLLGGGQKS